MTTVRLAFTLAAIAAVLMAAAITGVLPPGWSIVATIAAALAAATFTAASLTKKGHR